jgi:hypothetical protein
MATEFADICLAGGALLQDLARLVEQREAGLAILVGLATRGSDLKLLEKQIELQDGDGLRVVLRAHLLRDTRITACRAD